MGELVTPTFGCVVAVELTPLDFDLPRQQEAVVPRACGGWLVAVMGEV